MNLYRFFKMKAVYVFMLITTLLVAFIVVDGRATSDEEMQLYQEMEAENGGTAGIAIGIMDSFNIDSVTSEFISSSILLVFIAIFMSIFFNKERSKGYLKNLNSCTNKRNNLFLSKIPVVIIFVLMLFVSVWISAYFICDKVITCTFSEFIIYNVIELIIHIAFGVFICMLNELCRSTISLVLGIVAAVAVPTAILSGVMHLIPGLAKLSAICNFFTATLVPQVCLNGTIESAVALPIIVGVAVILAGIYAVIGLLSINKRDLF